MCFIELNPYLRQHVSLHFVPSYGSPFRAHSEHSIHAINGMTSLRTKQLKLVNYEKYETTPANYNYFENAFDYTSNCSPYFSILLHDSQLISG